jgi:hypothetical protein
MRRSGRIGNELRPFVADQRRERRHWRRPGRRRGGGRRSSESARCAECSCISLRTIRERFFNSSGGASFSSAPRRRAGSEPRAARPHSPRGAGGWTTRNPLRLVTRAPRERRAPRRNGFAPSRAPAHYQPSVIRHRSWTVKRLIAEMHRSRRHKRSEREAGAPENLPNNNLMRSLRFERWPSLTATVLHGAIGRRAPDGHRAAASASRAKSASCVALRHGLAPLASIANTSAGQLRDGKWYRAPSTRQERRRIGRGRRPPSA